MIGGNKDKISKRVKTTEKKFIQGQKSITQLIIQSYN